MTTESEANGSTGIIYVFENEFMPNLVKIGRTTQDGVGERLKDLFKSGVPAPFTCVYAAKVENVAKVERSLHRIFEPDRTHPKREWFRTEVDRVIEAISLANGEEITPNVVEEDEGIVKTPKAPRIKLSQLGIEQGATLIYSKNEKIEVTVTGDNYAKLDDNDETSMHRLTLQLLKEDGLTSSSVQWSPYWSFEGKPVKELYDQHHGIS